MSNFFDDLISGIQTLDAAIDERMRELTNLETRYPGKELTRSDHDRYKAEGQRIKDESDKKCRERYAVLETAVAEIRKTQPPLEKLSENTINDGGFFPLHLSFGRFRLSHELFDKGRIFVPRPLPFPFEHPIWFPSTGASLRQIHTLLLRFLSGIPLGKLEITAADPLHLGESFTPFKSLLPVKTLFPQERILTNADDIEKMLAQHAAYCEDLIQNCFIGKVKNWTDFNKERRDNPFACRVIVLVSIPEQITDKSIVYLERLMAHGPACGVLPLLMVDEQKCIDQQAGRKYTQLFTNITKHAARGDGLYPLRLKCIRVVEEEEPFPEDSGLRVFIEAVKARYEAALNVVRTVDTLFKDIPFWEGNSTESIEAPMGWEANGTPVNIVLDDVPSAALVAGLKGSGKSNLLHVIIQSLCYAYPPDELKLYLLDLKDGVEFNLYTSPPLPHANLVSIVNDVEYGVKVLTHLEEERQSRSELFKSADVKNFVEYRKTGEKLSRILLIIDEFHKLLDGKETEGLLASLLRQGRSSGIHIVLATQTLSGINVTSMGQLKNLIDCRIALPCTEEDSAQILAMDNREAAHLEPKKEAILNIKNGQKTGNCVFIHPLAETGTGKKYLGKFSEEARRRGYVSKTRVFKGEEMPMLQEAIMIDRTDELILELGEVFNYEGPPLRIRIPNKFGGNLLIAGSSKRLHDGLFCAILKSAATQVDEIVTLGGKDYTLSDIKNLRYCAGIEDLDLMKIRGELGKTRRLIIIDGLEDEKELRPAISSFGSKKEGGAQTPGELFRTILEEGSREGTFICAFSNNWTRLNTFYKQDALSSFELRVAYNLNEIQAGACLSGTAAGIKGLDNESCAIFADRLKNQQVKFRPYIQGET